jgi:uncharacterized protein YkwD
LSRRHHTCALCIVAIALLLVAPRAALAAARRTTPARAFLAAVNATRVSFGLRQLRVERALQRAAVSHSVDMLRRRYFAHGDFRDRMLAFHACCTIVGENLAWGTGTDASAKTIVREWLASPEHRANLLRPAYLHVGFGVVKGDFLGAPGTTVVTADFAG